MIIEENILDQAGAALTMVQPILLTEEGQKLESFISEYDLNDYLYSINGRVRFLDDMPEPAVWSSLIGHFRILLILRVNITELAELVNSQFTSMNVEGTEESIDGAPNTDANGQPVLFFNSMSNEQVVTFMLALAMRIITIRRAGDAVSNSRSAE